MAESLKCLLENISGPYPKIIVEFDFAEVVSILNRASEDWSEVATVAEEVQHYVMLVGSIAFSFCLREKNAEAHELARFPLFGSQSEIEGDCFLGSSTSEETFFC